MSTKTSPDTSLQTTKEMLDELDALMEKMLALPVADADDAPPFPDDVKAPTLTPTISATLTMLDPPASPPASEPIASHPVTNPPHFAPPPSDGPAATTTPVVAQSPPTLEPTAPLPTEPPAPAPQPVPLTNDLIPASAAPEIDPLLADIPDPESAATLEWVYSPLLSINQGFDHVTGYLGGAGEGLRGPAGRTFLGVLGLALIAAAAVWMLRDLLGWN